MAMATVTSKSIEIQKSLESLNLTSKAIQLIKDVIIHGFWGDSDFSFNCETKMSNVYITNDGARGKHFPRKQISGIMSGVAKAIKKYGCSFMASESDWWGDGSGSVLAFDIDFASYDELKAWAQATPEDIRAAMATVESEEYKADRKAREEFKAREGQCEHDERIKAVENRRNAYVAEFQECQDRKRIASLKRKIARAEARLEVLRSIDSLFRKPEEK